MKTVVNHNIDFGKVAMFTDIHFGKSNHSREHNENCIAFLKWFVKEARAAGCKTAAFLGDYNHTRGSINVTTLNYSYQGLKILSEGFDHYIHITGNHDSYYRDRIDVHSSPYIQEFPNVYLIDCITSFGDTVFVPWLIGEEWKEISSIRQPYVFGHFEFPNFYVLFLLVKSGDFSCVYFTVS